MAEVRRAIEVLTIEERERVANGLRQLDFMAPLGHRLVGDLVNYSRIYGTESGLIAGVEEEEPLGIEPSDPVMGPFLAVSVIRGVAQATHRAQGNRQRTANAVKRGAPPLKAGLVELYLPAGTYGRLDSGLQHFTFGDLRLQPLAGDRQEFLLLVATIEAAKIVPEMARRLYNAAPEPLKTELKKLLRPEVIWFDGHSAYDDVLRPMMHVLATAVARDRPNTGLVELGAEHEVAVWDEKRRRFVAKAVPCPENDLAGVVSKDKPGAVFVLRPSDPVNLGRLDNTIFDRVIYLAEHIPRALPRPLHARLTKDLFDPEYDKDLLEPRFASFIPTLPVPTSNPPPGSPRRPFDTLGIAHSTLDEYWDRSPRGVRPYRDACVVPVERTLLRRGWEQWLSQWKTGTPTPFLDRAVADKALSAQTVERWTRGLLLRRIGVALSGGGASCYRFIPVLEQLRDQNIPVDVFAGLSGGALLGVFYCLRGHPGLDQLVNLGWYIQATMPLASWSTAPYEYSADYLLGGARIENLEVRLGAVTVALPDEGPPCGAVIVQGTLGEAARASGTLPPSYAPTEKNCVRYADGGACSAVPARVARDCGADVILACNAIPGPQSCSPYPANVFGRILRRLPPWDRLIDFQTWYLFQWQQTSRRYAEQADAQLEFQPSSMSMAEPMLFMFARQIIAAARAETKKIEGAIVRLKVALQKLN
jgi:predicted acylesterase/phospholipase RssA